VKNIDLDPKKPTAEQVVAAYAKKLKKGVEEYEKVGRPEEAQQLRSEIAIVEEYLPTRASRDETAKLVEQFLAANPFTQKQLGQAMGAFMKAHGQNVEASVANQLLRERLAGK
jgi:uncharacterized protein YqeY